MDNHAAYEPMGVPRQIGNDFRARRRFRLAVNLAAWGIAGLITTTLPRLAANPDHIMLYFIFLIVGVLLVLLGVAAQDQPVAERVAARLEHWIGAVF